MFINDKIVVYIKVKKINTQKKRSRRCSAKTITNANYANDIVILANTPAQTETLLYSLE